MHDDDIQKNEEEIDTDPGDDVVFEENTEVTAPDATKKVDALRARVKELEKKNSELLDGWQRDKADFINARKQDEEKQKSFLKFANEGIISDLLPVLDSFQSAMKNKEAWEKADKNWRTGVEYIYSQLLSVLTQNGLAVINPIGDAYDHVRDEAVENVSVSDEKQDGKVLEVVQVGYALYGKEIRPPKVKVGELAKQ